MLFAVHPLNQLMASQYDNATASVFSVSTLTMFDKNIIDKQQDANSNLCGAKNEENI